MTDNSKTSNTSLEDLFDSILSRSINKTSHATHGLPVNWNDMLILRSDINKLRERLRECDSLKAKEESMQSTYDRGAKFKPKEKPRSNALKALGEIEQAYINSNKFILSSEDTVDERDFKLQGFKRVSHHVQTVREALQEKSNKVELRDYFAGLALQGMLAAGANWHDMYNKDFEISYKIADAMLEARNKKGV